MKSGLPSLNLLNAFDAAATHLSFKRAAQSLFITPPAISHQIRTLEKELGVELFKRMNRSIELTDEGKAYHREIAPALGQIKRATRDLKESKVRTPFRISSIPFITNNLLIPNIQTFIDKCPNIQVMMQSQLEKDDLGDNGATVAIRYSLGTEHDLVYERITRVSISPICSAAYLREHAIQTPEDLLTHRMIGMASDEQSWRTWSRANELSGSLVDGLIVDNYQGVLDAISLGMGIAIGYFPILNLPNFSKDLVTIFPDKSVDVGDIYLVYRKEEPLKSEVMLFKDWLMSIVHEAH